MYNAIQKYGWDNIQHDILHSNLTVDQAKSLELYYITEVYHSNDKRYGYNRTNGGDGIVGFKHSDQTKNRISVASKDMWKTPEFRDKMVSKHLGKNNPNYGKAMSEKQKQILSEYAKKRIGEKNPFYGKKHSDRTKSQISLNRRGKATGKDNPNSKKVICIETNEMFESASIAAKFYNMSVSNITNACRKSNKTAGGYHWKYIF